MRKIIVFIPLLILLFTPNYSADLDISGRIKLFSSVFLTENEYGQFFFHEKGEFACKRLEARLQFSGFLSKNVSYSLRFDSFSSPDAFFPYDSFPESSKLGAPLSTEPFEVFLYEGYIRVYNFLLPQLDLTLGKQRIQWGTADKLNVVDNLNPIDFANFLTFDPDYFGERRPQTGLNFEFYFSNWTKLQLVWLFSRQYSPLPAGFTNMVKTGPPYFYFHEVHIDKEKFLVENTNLGIRFSTVVFKTDLGLTYYRGNYHLPVLSGISINPWRRHQYYNYPGEDIWGVDVAGELFSVGFWAEGAYIRPTQIEGFLSRNYYLGDTLRVQKRVFPLFEESYFKYVVGMDYTLDVAEGLYFNAQYLHGFFDERNYTPEAEEFFGFQSGMFFGEIEDYITARAELTLLNEKLKIELGGIVEMAPESTSLVFMPSFKYQVLDYVTVQAGVFMVSGEKENTKFGTFKEDKLGYCSFKLDF